MRLSVLFGDDVLPLEIDEDESIENVKALLEVQTGIDAGGIALFHREVALSDAKSLKDYGVENDSLLVMVQGEGGGRRGAAPAAAGGGGGRTGSRGVPSHGEVVAASEDFSGLTWDDLPPGVDPNTLHRILQSNPRMVAEVESSNPGLAEAAAHHDSSKIRDFMIRQQMRSASRQLEKQAMQARLAADPTDAEAHRRLEEAIRQENVEENWRTAMENTPEVFAQVVMLYVPCEVNGIPLQAFVDSGAQMTIMSNKCAERCNLMRLLDTRFAGRALGVGSARILGRIHLAQLKLGETFFPISISIIESNNPKEFLLGLDNLRRHRATIDLAKNQLQIEGARGHEAIPFLPEHAIQERLGRDHDDGEDKDKDTTTAAAPSTNQDLSALVEGLSSSAAATTTAGASSAAFSEFDESKIAGLVALGFSRQDAVGALTATSGDEAMAANLLFERRN